MRRVVVCGAGGFIGSHLVRRLRSEGAWVRGVDLKLPEFGETAAHEFRLADLRDPRECLSALEGASDEVYQLAAEMGGAGFVFTGDHDAEIMHNSALINLNVAEACRRIQARRVFFSSSACVYPARNLSIPDRPHCPEDSVYPAEPDSEYGWEKLFSERLYLCYARRHGLPAKIARFHNTFGPHGAWRGGREKAPAALCRKVAEARHGGEIEVWGDGEQTRSFLYVDECLEGVRRLMDSDWTGPVNIGSEERVSINQLAEMIVEISGKSITLRHVAGPTGVRGRNSDNRLIESKLGWRPTAPLREGLEVTYRWVEEQVRSSVAVEAR